MWKVEILSLIVGVKLIYDDIACSSNSNKIITELHNINFDYNFFYR
jgi:hypothetical protein